MKARNGLPRPRSFQAATRRLARTGRDLLALLSDPGLSRSYWPDVPRKHRARIAMELIAWLVRHREANSFYYVYGLDRVGADRDDVMSFRGFQALRDRLNLRTGLRPHNFNYVCLLRDKFVFAQFATSLGVATPRVLALLDAQQVNWIGEQKAYPLEWLYGPDAPLVDGFCKAAAGMQGRNAFPLGIAQGQVASGGRTLPLEQLRERLSGGRFLLQQRIEQHPAMRALHGDSVNTLRLVTVHSGGQVSLLSSALRVGTGASVVDNWAAGGLIVRIDPERGVLRGEGFHKPGYGGRTATHPDSGVLFDRFELPCFTEAVDLVKRLHGYLPGIHSIGWDVAITPRGPVVIEGNDDWDGVIPMVLERDFRQRFAAACARAQAIPPGMRLHPMPPANRAPTDAPAADRVDCGMMVAVGPASPVARRVRRPPVPPPDLVGG